MGMKKITIFLGLLLAFSVVQPVHAQVIDQTTDNSTIIALLEQIISLLEQELALAQSTALSQTPTVQVTTSPSIQQVGNASTPSIPSCESTGHGSISPSNCVRISPTTVQEGTTATFTITASPFLFMPVSGNDGFSLSQDQATLTYTIDIPTTIRGNRINDTTFLIYLENGLQDNNGNQIPITHPYFVTIASSTQIQ